MSIDWTDVLDDLEQSIVDGSEFVPPSVTDVMPTEYGPRLRALMALCTTRTADVEAEIASTSDELSRLTSRRRTQRPAAANSGFSQVL